MAIHWDRRSYTEEEFIQAWNASSSIAECCRKLGVMQSGGAAKSFNRTARALGLSKDHMEKKYNQSTGYRSSRDLEEILVEDSDYTNSSVLRRRLIREGILKPICIGCHRDTWVNFITGEEEPMNLTLDHINGINYDNRLETCGFYALHVILTLQHFAARIRRLLNSANVALGYSPHLKNAIHAIIKH